MNSFIYIIFTVNNILHQCQFGFRKHHFNAMALFR